MPGPDRQGETVLELSQVPGGHSCVAPEVRPCGPSSEPARGGLRRYLSTYGFKSCFSLAEYFQQVRFRPLFIRLRRPFENNRTSQSCTPWGADSDSWLLTSWGSPCLVPATPG